MVLVAGAVVGDGKVVEGTEATGGAGVVVVTSVSLFKVPAAGGGGSLVSAEAKAMGEQLAVHQRHSAGVDGGLMARGVLLVVEHAYPHPARSATTVVAIPVVMTTRDLQFAGVELHVRRGRNPEHRVRAARLPVEGMDVDDPVAVGVDPVGIALLDDRRYELFTQVHTVGRMPMVLVGDRRGVAGQ